MRNRRNLNDAQKARVENAGVLTASGLIAGEAMAGLAIAAYRFRLRRGAELEDADGVCRWLAGCDGAGRSGAGGTGVRPDQNAAGQCRPAGRAGRRRLSCSGGTIPLRLFNVPAEILVRQSIINECHPLNHATASVVLVAVSFAADTSARSPNLRGRGPTPFPACAST